MWVFLPLPLAIRLSKAGAVVFCAIVPLAIPNTGIQTQTVAVAWKVFICTFVGTLILFIYMQSAILWYCKARDRTFYDFLSVVTTKEVAEYVDRRTTIGLVREIRRIMREDPTWKNVRKAKEALDKPNEQTIPGKTRYEILRGKR